MIHSERRSSELRGYSEERRGAIEQPRPRGEPDDNPLHSRCSVCRTPIQLPPRISKCSPAHTKCSAQVLRLAVHKIDVHVHAHPTQVGLLMEEAVNMPSEASERSHSLSAVTVYSEQKRGGGCTERRLRWNLHQRHWPSLQCRKESRGRPADRPQRRELRAADREATRLGWLHVHARAGGRNTQRLTNLHAVRGGRGSGRGRLQTARGQTHTW
jgi:hypothetical protein